MKKWISLTVAFLFSLLILSPPAHAQVSVPSTYFGVTASGQLSSTCNYDIWWPNNVSASSPAISIGAAGKMIMGPWGVIDNQPSTLSWTSDSSGAGGYWTGTVDFCQLNDYITAAQGSSVPVMYTFFQVPQWAVCFDYTGTGQGGDR